jgi:hypothetical protein
MAGANKGGPESKYRPEFAEEARRRCASGAIMRELADSWGITPRTITYWKRDFPELKKAIAEGRAECKRRRAAGGLGPRRREKAAPRRITRAEIVYVRP